MNFLNILEDVLKRDKRFVADDGKLLKPIIHANAMNMDKNLISLLISNEDIRSHFFTDVDGVLVFDKVKFTWVVGSKEFLPDSYTRYGNKIGLVDNSGDLISAKGDVTLVWPYKDCVLAGGQTKDDQKRDEIFYNETLAPDEVKRLLHPKVLTDAKRYTKDGAEDITTFDDKDNLIIKGNNLLALSSLLARYEGKVKCIYIDPPYNTGNDSFNYNDNFNHSSWLTFMKNRLELAKRLLSDDGVIFIHCDDNEQAYLKVFCDEIFGRRNFLSSLVIKGGSGRQDSTNYAMTHEFIVTYAKSINFFELNKCEIQDKVNYNKTDSSGRKYTTQLLRKWGSNDKRVDRPNLYFAVALDGEEFLPISGSGEDGCWRWKKERVLKAIANDDIVSGTTPSGKRELYQKIYQSDISVKQVTYTTILEDNLSNSYSGKGTREFKEIFSKDETFSSPKSEVMMKQLLEMVTSSTDLVLDFHLGSGTTAAVAHKMGRQYIGVEQMDYINTVTVPRLQKVIEGEQGGISKDVDWQGGGSFVYCELKELNEAYVKEIQVATTKEQLEGIKSEIVATGFISHKVNIKEIADRDAEFDDLTLAQQKQLLMELINKNKLYVNYSEIDDEDMKVSDAEKAFTHSFYKRGV